MIKHFSESKRGLSTVIASLLLILLTIALVGIIWTAVTKLVNTEIDKSDCLDSVGKVNLNHQYICYNGTSKELMFSISLGDIEVEEVAVAVSGGGIQKSFMIKDENSTINYLRPLIGVGAVALPEKNSGTSYFYNIIAAGFPEDPDSLAISPKIGGNLCSPTDSADEITPCYAME